MAQILKLKDASAPWRKLIDAFREDPQEGVVQDENDETVAVILPRPLYQLYQQQRAKDFEVFKDVRKDLQDYSDEELQERIDLSIAEVKAGSSA
jgi:hypothetical protein